MKQSRRNTVRRFITRVSIFLLLGVIVNVVVAWSCALWMSQEPFSTGDKADVPQAWPSYLEQLDLPPPSIAMKGVHFYYDVIPHMGVTVIEITGGDPQAGWNQPNPTADNIWVSLDLRQFGIPFRALQWERHTIAAGKNSWKLQQKATSVAGWRMGINVSKQIGARAKGNIRRLPLTPIWLGFTINTIFYGAILWLIFITPGITRRLIRKRRGCYIRCGYDLRGAAHERCTECGCVIRHAHRNQ